MPLSRPFDLGTVYSKNPAGGLGTTPSFTTTMVIDRATLLRFEVVAALNGASSAGNLTITATSSRDGTNFDAMQVTDDAAGTTGATGTVTTSAGSTVRKSFSLDPRGYKGGVRVSVVTAGAPNAADLVTIAGEAV